MHTCDTAPIYVSGQRTANTSRPFHITPDPLFQTLHDMLPSGRVFDIYKYMYRYNAADLSRAKSN